jgi:hypothetical protein
MVRTEDSNRRKEPEMARKKKPLADVDVVCPCCSSELRVEVHRKRIGEAAPPPEYDYEVNVHIQKNLFPKALKKAREKEAAAV